MTRFFQFVIVGIILGAVLMLLASIVSSCYFFITTFTLSDFEERTASFVLGAVSALFTYGMFRILMNALFGIPIKRIAHRLNDWDPEESTSNSHKQE